MKKNVLLLITMISLFFANTYAQEEQEKPLRLKGVTMENDYHKDISWIKSRPIPLEAKEFTTSAYDVSYIQLYFGMYVEDGKQKITEIHIVNQYRNSRWVFFDEISYLLGSRKEIRSHQGKVFGFKDDDTNTKVDRGVAEKSDVLITKEIEAFIRYVIEQPSTGLEIRYTNNRSNTKYDLSANGGTKLLQKHFIAFITAYNQVNELYSIGKEF